MDKAHEVIVKLKRSRVRYRAVVSHLHVHPPREEKRIRDVTSDPSVPSIQKLR